MNASRPTFVAHMILSLGCAGLAFYAWRAGAVMMVWQNDLSMMTSVIAVIFLSTLIWLGRQAWSAEDYRYASSANVGHLAERLCVMGGFVGTAIGLCLQAKSLAGGATSFGALSTSLFTTASGGIAAALIAVMTFSVEHGIERARR